MYLAGELLLAPKTHQMLGVFCAGLIVLVGVITSIASGFAIVDHGAKRAGPVFYDVFSVDSTSHAVRHHNVEDGGRGGIS